MHLFYFKSVTYFYSDADTYHVVKKRIQYAYVWDGRPVLSLKRDYIYFIFSKSYQTGAHSYITSHIFHNFLTPPPRPCHRWFYETSPCNTMSHYIDPPPLTCDVSYGQLAKQYICCFECIWWPDCTTCFNWWKFKREQRNWCIISIHFGSWLVL